MRLARLWFVPLVGLALSACVSAPKPVETGRRGLFDVWSEGGSSNKGVAKKKKVSSHEASEEDLAVGANTWDGKRVARTGEERFLASKKPRRKPKLSKQDKASLKQEVAENDWRWPLDRVEITSVYGRRGRRVHEGVDLKALVGTPVYAVADGVVIYAGEKISGFGRMVVLKHSESGLFTIYAHHSENRVDEGDAVKRGDVIGLSGATGRAKGPHLHFEVRRGTKSVDPQAVLPKSGARVAGLNP